MLKKLDYFWTNWTELNWTKKSKIDGSLSRNLFKCCLRLFKDLKLEEFQIFHSEFKEDIYENLNPVNVVKYRNSLGGTGFDQVKVEINKWQKKIVKQKIN